MKVENSLKYNLQASNQCICQIFFLASDANFFVSVETLSYLLSSVVNLFYCHFSLSIPSRISENNSFSDVLGDIEREQWHEVDF